MLVCTFFPCSRTFHLCLQAIILALHICQLAHGNVSHGLCYGPCWDSSSIGALSLQTMGVCISMLTGGPPTQPWGLLKPRALLLLRLWVPSLLLCPELLLQRLSLNARPVEALP